MQKILYLLLLVSVASFGQSDKVKLNSNNDSIYNPVCFALNDSASVFKLFEFGSVITQNQYTYRLKGVNYDAILNFPAISAGQDKMIESDSNNLKIYVERQKKETMKLFTNADIKQSITTIGNNYEAYQLDVNSKIATMDIVIKTYILKYKNNFINIALLMQPNANSTYYLQEFNKLVNTIRFK